MSLAKTWKKCYLQPVFDIIYFLTIIVTLPCVHTIALTLHVRLHLTYKNSFNWIEMYVLLTLINCELAS